LAICSHDLPPIYVLFGECGGVPFVEHHRVPITKWQ